MLKLDLHLQRGRFCLDVACELTARTTGLFGPSGAGKTTILHLLSGLIRPEKGHIVLDGEVLFDSSRRICMPTHKRGVGVVFQDDRLFPHYTVRDNLLYGQKLVRRQNPPFSLDDVVDILELQHLLIRSIEGLSGGERRRVTLGRALLQSPRLLLLDEPLCGLDQHRRQQLLPFLRRVQEKVQIPILLVSHDLSEILHLTQEMLMIDQGSVVAVGKFSDLVGQAQPLELMHEAGLRNVVRLQVKEHRPDEGMTFLTPFDGTVNTTEGGHRKFLVKGPWLKDLLPGTAVDAILRPEDIALTRAPIEQISIQNQLRGYVQKILCVAEKTFCLIDVGVLLLVEVTHRSVEDLGLSPGQPVWCLFKALAVQCVATRNGFSQAVTESSLKAGLEKKARLVYARQ